MKKLYKMNGYSKKTNFVNTVDSIISTQEWSDDDKDYVRAELSKIYN